LFNQTQNLFGRYSTFIRTTKSGAYYRPHLNAFGLGPTCNAADLIKSFFNLAVKVLAIHGRRSSNHSPNIFQPNKSGPVIAPLIGDETGAPFNGKIPELPNHLVSVSHLGNSLRADEGAYLNTVHSSSKKTANKLYLISDTEFCRVILKSITGCHVYNPDVPLSKAVHLLHHPLPSQLGQLNLTQAQQFAENLPIMLTQLGAWPAHLSGSSRELGEDTLHRHFTNPRGFYPDDGLSGSKMGVCEHLTSGIDLSCWNPGLVEGLY